LARINSNKVATRVAIIVILFIFLWTCPNTQAQTEITFSPADKFSIPLYNGTISFAVNGTYSKATFENNTWTFTNLRLSGSQPLENFTISTQNSNVTIVSYRTANATTFRSARLRYVVKGQGKQILNLGLGSEESGLSASAEWSVIFNNNIFVSEGNGWDISHNGTMVITGATGNVSIVHYGFLGFYGNIASRSNLPFYEQHSVAIVIALAVAVTVVIAIVIKVKNREHSGESELGNNAQANYQGLGAK
jgi:hypothetical protein